VQARQFSSNGSLVICDRYSFPGFMKMDGPQCEDALASSKKMNWFLKFLSNREKIYYQQIKLPDLLIVLKADPEITVQRKKNETQTSVRARSTEVWKLDWGQKSAYVIDASPQRGEVVSQVKSLVWAHL
jgi:thymidylate kinase